jgi:hypothetical protein
MRVGGRWPRLIDPADQPPRPGVAVRRTTTIRHSTRAAAGVVENPAIRRLGPAREDDSGSMPTTETLLQANQHLRKRSHLLPTTRYCRNARPSRQTRVSLRAGHHRLAYRRRSLGQLLVHVCTLAGSPR